MEKRNKYIYLIIGIIIGAIAVTTTYEMANINRSDEISADEEINHTEENNEVDEHAEDVVKLNDGEINELGIKLSKVDSQKLQIHTDLTGEIVIDPDRIAHIVPRFTGIVKNVYKKIGDNVKKDETIAVIESNESLVTYEVKSSMNGVVLDLHMTPGELIGDDKHIVTVADLNSVWAELKVYQKDITDIKLGQMAQIYLNDINKSVEGKIFYLSPTVEEDTRTAKARVRLNNKSGKWKPGMFITAKVITSSVQVKQAVLLSAIQNFEEQQVVFLKEGESFRPQPISIGRTNSTYAEILSGLNAGQYYVADGAFRIKSELLKESFGGGHNH